MMTIEEKAQAYDIAIEKVKKYHTPESNNANLKAVLEDIFPTLVEDEDEKIRNFLIEKCNEGHWPERNIFKKEQVIAWLEKQKNIQYFTIEELIKSFRSSVKEDWDFSKCPGVRDEIRRCFGKHLILPHTEETKITISDFMRCASHFYEFGKNAKPAEWSEQCKKRIDGIAKYIKSKGYEDDAEFLESLYPQANIEWSEEDYHWEGLVQLLRDYQKTIDRKSNNMAYEDVECYIDWLKSLHPQEKQKPIFRVGDTIIAKDGTCIDKEPFYIDKIEDGFYWDGDSTVSIYNQDEFELYKPFVGWPNVTNCRHNCKICQARCLYRKEKYVEEDKCAGCNNVKGCITCEDGDQWAHFEVNTKSYQDGFDEGVRVTKEMLQSETHWKPTDEQMKALDIALRCGIQLRTWEETALASLRDDLSNL